MATSDSADAFRWQSFFQHSSQPIFLLNRRRRVLFVNRAWESCTGLTLAEARGRVCRRRAVASAPDREEMILSACAPPQDAVASGLTQVRRRVPGGTGWWELQFLPIAATDGQLGYLGVIRSLPASQEPPLTIPEKLMALRDRAAARYRLDDLDRTSPVMQRVYEQAKLASETNIPITLVGESGAGKEWLARALHGRGADRHRYFVRLDADQVPFDRLTELFESRLQLLGAGTVYLCEPPALPRELQAKLVDAIASGKRDERPRWILGMTREARAEVQAGRLLEELACACGTLTITLPPLRERLSELTRFVDVFLAREASIGALSVRGFGAEATAALKSYAWPGNLRELQEIVRAVCRRAKTEKVDLAELPFYLKQGPLPAERRLPLDTLLEQVERRLIALALNLTQDNQTRAAELLEIWRPRLLRRMEKFGFKTEGDGASSD